MNESEALSIQVEQSATSTVESVEKPQNRANSGQFKKGQTGNPGGRPKSAGLSAYIKAKTKDGKTLVDHALAVLADAKADPKDAATARAYLTAYGFGKPVETQEINATVRSLQIADALAPYLDPTRKEELGRILGSLRSQADEARN